jgi:hypothetical protein
MTRSLIAAVTHHSRKLESTMHHGGSPSLLRILAGCLFVCTAGGGATAAAQSRTASASSAPDAGRPAVLRGLADEAGYVIYKDDEPIIRIRQKLSATGLLEADATVSLAGQSAQFALKISVDDEGRFTRIDQETPVGQVTSVRDGAIVTVTARGKTTTITLKPDTILFENFTPGLISMALRAYDRTRGGKQTFPLFIVPQIVMEGSLEPGDKAQRSVGGRDYEFQRYTYALPGVDLTVWADADGRVYFVDVPAQHAAYVREGFEALLKATADDPLLSAPTFDVQEERGVGVPMRDGVKLSTDLFRPATDAKCPVILIRTPYKKEMSELDGKYYARRGYVVAIQDCRGRFGSPGVWEPFVNEPQDGFDTIEWLAAQPWSTGKVGMIGASYLGWVQWWAARESPPHLVTIIPNVSPPDPFYNIPYEYGVFFMMGSIWWAEVVHSEATGDLSGRTMTKIADRKYESLLRPLPVIELDKVVFGAENPHWRTWIEHNTNDAYWDRADFLDRLKSVTIPVFHQSGWFDGDGIGSKLNYLAMAAHGHSNQKLVLGPWGHSAVAHRMAGEHDFGPAAIIDLPRDYLRWFDYWLKGVDNGIMREPLVSLFVMGHNKWLHGEKYPLPQTRFEKWYLTSRGGANTSKGDGRLVREPPAADAPADRFTYDPADPTPAPQFHEESREDEQQVRSVDEKKRIAERHHQDVTDARRDILVYTTDELSEPLTIVGPVSAVLYASSSAKDTDWFMRLIQVGKDGKLFPLAEGKIRARFRESMSAPKPLEPGKVYEYGLDLWQTGITLSAGYRLRVEVASASFPLWSRNLNTGGHNERETEFVAAEQVIYHDASRPSHVLLPVIPADDPGLQ